MKLDIQGCEAFQIAAYLHTELFPEDKTFDGNSRRAHKIYKALKMAYVRGLSDGVWSEEPERKRLRVRTDRELGISAALREAQ